ncbi:hypothetical protein GCM10020295_39380 [Streptomyces cinereospinus]
MGAVPYVLHVPRRGRPAGLLGADVLRPPPHPIDEKPQLLESIDDWNRRTLWPKLYSHTHDDGTVRLIGEAQMLIGTGVNLEFFVSSTVSWVRAAIEFDRWLVEQLGLEKEINDADKPGDEE